MVQREKRRENKRAWKGLAGAVLAVALAAGGGPGFFGQGSAVVQAVQAEAAESTAESVLSALTPSALCKGADGKLYVLDTETCTVRVMTGTGTDLAAGVSGESGFKDGKAAEVKFSSPWDLEVYQKGLAISDTENNRIRFLKGGKVKTLAGSGKKGKADKKGTKATFSRPTGIAAGKNGVLYIADTGNHRIRVMDKNGNVKTFAGSSKGCSDGTVKKAKFNEPTGLFYSGGVLYVADSGNHRVCKIKNGKVTTVAGSKKGVEGDKDAKGTSARLSNPQGVCYQSGKLYIADTGNAAVKVLKNGSVTTKLAGYSLQDGILPAGPRALCIKNGYLYIGDILADQVVRTKL